ncbi:chymotrypsin-2-like isoform X5 [Diachasmimorpha longicaudata]|uniref:chymotrypsin-2-like isoform X5 n=1 Tax=Diachasmimorpha longicaudata TaxID=58733 RepID=UPI0030B8F847
MYSSLWICICSILIGNIRDGAAIHYGDISRMGRFKSIVTVFTRSKFCGGAILDRYHILTAAHCVICKHPSQLKVIAGDVDFQSDECEVRDVAKIEVYEGFRPADDKKFVFMLALCLNAKSLHDFITIHDIAVLTLAKPLDLGPKVRSVTLPRNADIPKCKLVSFAGWGNTEDGEPDGLLRHASFNIVPFEMSDIWEWPRGPNQFHILDLFGNAQTDEGDDGGPLIDDDMLHGVLSRNIDTAEGVSIVTKIYPYLKFIRAAMADRN